MGWKGWGLGRWRGSVSIVFIVFEFEFCFVLWDVVLYTLCLSVFVWAF